MTDLSDLKNAVVEEADSLETEISDISRAIHANPELGLKEYKASGLLCSELQKHGFSVARGIAGMQTAFRATITVGRGGPHLAYLAEYDALPQIGHGCGHNIIGTSAVVSAIALSRLSSRGLNGKITVLGTPDEEGSGGKVPIIRAGFFEDVDAAMMCHPWNFTSAWMPTVAIASLNLEFAGKAAHYSTPHRGVNALDALMLTLTTVNGLRHGFRNDVVFGYSIDQGGVSPSIVPEKASARLWIKSTDIQNLMDVVGRVKTCAEGIANSIGARATVRHDYPLFEESIPNLTLIRAISENFARLGIQFKPPEETSRSLVYVSSDYGNVSHVVPSASPAIAIGAERLSAHTVEFAEAAISDRGIQALIEIIKVMTMTGIDILGAREILQSAQAEFSKYKASGFTRVPYAPIY